MTDTITTPRKFTGYPEYVMICISCVSLVTIYFVSRAVQRKKQMITAVTGTAAPITPAAEVLPEV